MIRAALEEDRRRGGARFGQKPDRERLKRSLSLMREIAHSEDGDKPGETPADAAPTAALKRRLAR